MTSHVTRWRNRTRSRLITAFGGRCGLCGYDRCVRNLALHHTDPSKKDKNVWQTKNWQAIIADARGCVLLCHNCHGEVHDGLVSVDNCQRFDETYAEYTLEVRDRAKTRPVHSCYVCGKETKNVKFCSVTCRSIDQRRVSRPDLDTLLSMLSVSSYLQVAKQFGVSDHAVRRWIKSHGLKPSDYSRRNMSSIQLAATRSYR